MIGNERIPFDYVVKNTSLGPTCFQRGDNVFRNQNGELIAKLRSTAMRYSAEAGGDAVNPADFEDSEWTDLGHAQPPHRSRSGRARLHARNGRARE